MGLLFPSTARCDNWHSLSAWCGFARRAGPACGRGSARRATSRRPLVGRLCPYAGTKTVHGVWTGARGTAASLATSGPGLGTKGGVVLTAAPWAFGPGRDGRPNCLGRPVAGAQLVLVVVLLVCGDG